MLVINNNGPVRLLRNHVGAGSHWLGVRAVHGTPPRDSLGAVVTLERPGQPTVLRRLRTAGSYASGNDPRALFGLGPKGEITRLTVRWPDGKREAWSDLPVDAYVTLARGTGKALP